MSKQAHHLHNPAAAGDSDVVSALACLGCKAGGWGDYWGVAAWAGASFVVCEVLWDVAGNIGVGM
jgi:hypothetical protein